jgi:hypothetical protein
MAVTPPVGLRFFHKECRPAGGVTEPLGVQDGYITPAMHEINGMEFKFLFVQDEHCSIENRKTNKEKIEA